VVMPRVALFFEENLMKCRLLLICIDPFGPYLKGDNITDPAEVKALLKYRDHFAPVRSIVRSTKAASTK
jgi:hypothetical protein